MQTILSAAALPSYVPSDDCLLVAGLLADDPRAWSEFNQRFGRLIDRCIRRVLGRFSYANGDEEVREVNATLCLQLLARDKYKLRSYNEQRGTKFSTWLGLLANHAAYDYLRSRRRDPQLREVDCDLCDESVPNPFDACAAREEAERVSQLLASFSEKDRQFVILYFSEGLEPEEVAREMGISVKTVYSKKHKIRARLEELVMRKQLAA
jgi:RNA polymerase sigma-70 factor, ECF subfamily